MKLRLWMKDLQGLHWEVLLRSWHRLGGMVPAVVLQVRKDLSLWCFACFLQQTSVFPPENPAALGKSALLYFPASPLWVHCVARGSLYRMTGNGKALPYLMFSLWIWSEKEGFILNPAGKLEVCFVNSGCWSKGFLRASSIWLWVRCAWLS